MLHEFRWILQARAEREFVVAVPALGYGLEIHRSDLDSHRIMPRGVDRSSEHIDRL